MPQRINVPGQGIVEFPDNMADDQIQEAIKSNFPEIGGHAQNLSITDKAKLMLGPALQAAQITGATSQVAGAMYPTTIANAVGTLIPERVKQAWRRPVIGNMFQDDPGMGQAPELGRTGRVMEEQTTESVPKGLMPGTGFIGGPQTTVNPLSQQQVYRPPMGPEAAPGAFEQALPYVGAPLATINEVMSGFSSPEALAMLAPFTPHMGYAAPMIMPSVRAAIVADMAGRIPENTAQRFAQAGSSDNPGPEALKAGTGTLADVMLTGLGSHGIDVGPLPYLTEPKTGARPTEGYPPNKPYNFQSGVKPEDLRPAIRLAGHIIVGEPGETHADILKRWGGVDHGHPDPNRGFVDKNNPEQFLSRMEAAQGSGINGSADAGGLDSMDLPGAGMRRLMRIAGMTEEGVNNAVSKLRTDNISKEQAPGNLQTMGEEVRPGAEGEGVARGEEPQEGGEQKYQSGIGSVDPEDIARAVKMGMDYGIGKLDKRHRENVPQFVFRVGKDKKSAEEITDHYELAQAISATGEKHHWIDKTGKVIESKLPEGTHYLAAQKMLKNKNFDAEPGTEEIKDAYAKMRGKGYARVIEQGKNVFVKGEANPTQVEAAKTLAEKSGGKAFYKDEEVYPRDTRKGVEENVNPWEDFQDDVRDYPDEPYYSGIGKEALDKIKDVFTASARLVLRSPEKLKLSSKAKDLDAGQLVNRVLNTIPKTEREILEVAGIKERFKPGERTTLKEVDDWVKKNGPKVEVRKLRAEAGSVTTKVREAAEAMHYLETQGYEVKPDSYGEGAALFKDGKEVDYKNLPFEHDAAFHKLIDSGFENEFSSESATARFQSVNPKPLSEMPGAVDILVRKPVTRDLFRNYDTIKDRGGLKFMSQHYPNEGLNLLAHVRGYMETLPNGKKVFHIFEVQSDWAQHIRELKDMEVARPQDDATRQRQINKQNDPLLKRYEHLALKAAIEHAKSEGADAIAISDAETAMMTEGHLDPNAPYNRVYRRGSERIEVERGSRAQQNLLGEGWKTGEIVPQSAKGMELHYDKILPKIAEELTGSKPQDVSFGEHQNYEGADPEYKQGMKNRINARMFDISKAPETPYSSTSTKYYSGLPIPSLNKIPGVDKLLLDAQHWMHGKLEAPHNWDRASVLLDGLETKANLIAKQQIDEVRNAPKASQKALLARKYTQQQVAEASKRINSKKLDRQTVQIISKPPGKLEAWLAARIPSLAKKPITPIERMEIRLSLGQTALAYKAYVDELGKLTVKGQPFLKNAPGKGKYPSADYTVMDVFGMRKAVHKDMVWLVKALTEPSAATYMPVFDRLLRAEATIKHNTLAYDFFHLMRMAKRSATTKGGLPTYQKGLSLLEHNDKTINLLEKNGEITPEMADWVRSNRGKANLLVAKGGLNVGRFSDAMYRDQIVFWPGVKTLNRFIFDKFTRGAMMETAIAEFDRHAENNPGLSQEQVAMHVGKQMNVIFGNLGRQGVLKSETARDVARLIFLAPQWFESLAQIEARAYKQAAEVPVTGKMGSAVKMVTTAMLAQFAVNQVFNMYTRGQPTWDNKEKGRKFDAFIPDYFGRVMSKVAPEWLKQWKPGLTKEAKGFWLSPTAEMELTHDVMGYHKKGMTARQIGQRITTNKLSPFGRAEEVYRTGRDFTGAPLSDNEAVELAGLSLLPAPIPIASLGSEVPGGGQRQLLNMAGFKAEPVGRRELIESDIEHAPLGKRLQLEQKFREDEPKVTGRQKIAMIERASAATARRGLDIQAGLDTGDRQWLESRKLDLPGVENYLTIAGVRTTLSQDEQARYEELVKDGYVKAITALRKNYDNIKTDKGKEMVYSKVMTVFKDIARKKMLAELARKNRPGAEQP